MLIDQQALRFLHYSDQQCVEILMRARWPDGFRCPRCGSAEHYRIQGRRLPLFACAVCRRQCSLISGTVMERSRVPLQKWFTAVALLASRPIRATMLAERIRVTYKTAWLMLHKLRNAMSCQEERDRLTGLIRFEVVKSGPSPLPWVRNLGEQEHPFVIGGSMEGGPDGRVLGIKLMQDTGGDTYIWRITPRGVLRFIEKHVDLREAVIDWPDYRQVLKRVHSLWKIASDIAWDIATTHRGVGSKYRQAYLHEHAYRFNRASREPSAHGHLLRLAASSGAPTLRQLKSRPVPGRPDWDTYRNPRRMHAELRELAAGIMRQTPGGRAPGGHVPGGRAAG